MSKRLFMTQPQRICQFTIMTPRAVPLTELTRHKKSDPSIWNVTLLPRGKLGSGKARPSRSKCALVLNADPPTGQIPTGCSRKASLREELGKAVFRVALKDERQTLGQAQRVARDHFSRDQNVNGDHATIERLIRWISKTDVYLRTQVLLVSRNEIHVSLKAPRAAYDSRVSWVPKMRYAVRAEVFYLVPMQATRVSSIRARRKEGPRLCNRIGRVDDTLHLVLVFERFVRSRRVWLLATSREAKGECQPHTEFS